MLAVALITALALAPRPTVVARVDHAAVPTRIVVIDDTQSIDANQIGMALSNYALYAMDVNLGGPGLEYPRGSGRHAMFAAGLWLGARVGGSVRLALSEYSSEYRPGAMIGSSPEDASQPRYRVYKLLRYYPSESARDSALEDYVNGAMLPDGAPRVDPLGTLSLSIPGDQMLWSVCNDASAVGHSLVDGGTAPLGVEVQQTTWASDRLGALGSTVFIGYRILNKSLAVLDSMYLAAWSDPDLGAFQDDLVGWDATRGLGYCYNGAPTDAEYGANPPAIGMDLLRGPKLSGGGRLGPSAFVRYINGTDPQNSSQAWNLMKGLHGDGTPVVNPLTSLPTTYYCDGDPVAATGWLDTNPGDRRMMVCSGPFTMQPGDTQEVVIAVLAAQGSDRFNSISLLRSYDEAAQAYIDAHGDTVVTAVPGHDLADAAFALEAPRPNPGRGVLSVAFTLADRRPATLELLDLAGRRVFARDLDTVGAGRHVVTFARPGALAPGLYFLKLSQGGRSVARRVTLLR